MEKRVEKMSKTELNERFYTTLKDDHFLYFADNSNLGILIIQKGYIKYVNKKSVETLGYSLQDISRWKKREFFKIIHPEDLNQLLQNLTIEDKDAVSFQFRVFTKKGEMISVKTYLNIIKYNNERAYLLSYAPMKKSSDKYELYASKTIKITTEKKIALDYHPNVIKLLEDNNLDFEIINHCSYREEM